MNSPLNRVLQHLRKTALREEVTTDAHLLEAFVHQGDNTALAALVDRHGPMVWGVCRRLLHRHHDAEDAFQTTFLVLVRKAASIRHRERLANWLYGVAHQTSVQARRVVAKRGEREKQMSELPEPVEQPERSDLLAVLDQELSRLPDRHRTAIVLCDLEGRTRKEAARLLGWPEGTMASRLARARAMLARRLARHGLGASGAAIAAVLSESRTSAGVPPASVFAMGQVVSPAVTFLTEGVVKAMFVTRLKVAAVVLLVATATIGTGAGLVTYKAHGQGNEALAAGADELPRGKVIPDDPARRPFYPWMFPDKGVAVQTEQNGTIRVWEVATDKLVWEVNTGKAIGIDSVTFSPDGKILAVVSSEGSVRLFQASSGKQLAVKGVTFTPKGEVLVKPAEGDVIDEEVKQLKSQIKALEQRIAEMEAKRKKNP